MAVETKNYYEVLGVSMVATDDEIRAAFRAAVRKYHPDVSGDPNTRELYEAAVEARNVLLDPRARADLDVKLGMGREKVQHDAPPRTNRTRTQSSGKSTPVPDHYDVPEYRLDETLLEEPSFKFANRSIWKHVVVAIVAITATAEVYLRSKLEIGVWMWAGMFIGLVLASQVRKLLKGVVLPWWGSAGLVGASAGLGWLVARLYQHVPLVWMGYMALMVATIVLGLLGILARVRNVRRVIRPKDLKRSNFYKFSEGDYFTNVLEESISPMWGLKATRGVRIDHPAFSYMLFVGNKVFLLKGVSLHNAGEVTTSGYNIINRHGRDGFDLVMDSTYGSSLETFLSMAAKKFKNRAELFPFVVVYPSEYALQMTDQFPVNFVRGVDASELMLSVVSNDKTPNVVDQELVADMTLFAFESASSYRRNRS